MPARQTSSPPVLQQESPQCFSPYRQVTFTAAAPTRGCSSLGPCRKRLPGVWSDPTSCPLWGWELRSLFPMLKRSRPGDAHRCPCAVVAATRPSTRSSTSAPGLSGNVAGGEGPPWAQRVLWEHRSLPGSSCSAPLHSPARQTLQRPGLSPHRPDAEGLRSPSPTEPLPAGKPQVRMP